MLLPWLTTIDYQTNKPYYLALLTFELVLSSPEQEPMLTLILTIGYRGQISLTFPLSPKGILGYGPVLLQGERWPALVMEPRDTQLT